MRIRIFKGGAIAFVSLLAFALMGCGSSLPEYYEMDKLLSLDGKDIVKVLEENQGLEYEQAYENGEVRMKGWCGEPSKNIADHGEVDESHSVVVALIEKEDVNKNNRYITRDELLSGETEIEKVFISFTTYLRSEQEAVKLVDDIVSQCGFTDVVGEKSSGGKTGSTIGKMGKCKIGDEDAYWLVTAMYLPKGMYVDITVNLLGDKTYEDVRKANLS